MKRSQRVAPQFSRGGRLTVETEAGICAFGWKARDFALRGVDDKTYSLADVRGPKGRGWEIGTIAIMPNDTKTYQEDSFDNMRAFAAKHGFTFPYVIDGTQEVARA